MLSPSNFCDAWDPSGGHVSSTQHLHCSYRVVILNRSRPVSLAHVNYPHHVYCPNISLIMFLSKKTNTEKYIFKILRKRTLFPRYAPISFKHTDLRVSKSLLIYLLGWPKSFSITTCRKTRTNTSFSITACRKSQRNILAKPRFTFV